MIAMQIGALFLTLLSLAPPGGSTVSYLPTIQARWNASDLVCIGDSSAPHRTGVVQVIDGAKRDQLSAYVELETCLKGAKPQSSEIRVLGDYFTSVNGQNGFGYAGPPTGFVHEGRDLLFLRRSSSPDEFLVTVPIYQTTIPLANTAPNYPPTTSSGYAKVVLTRELESAMLQTAENDQGVNPSPGFGDGLLSDIEYINLLLDYLGKSDGTTELSRLYGTAPSPICQDIAVMLFDRGQQEYESAVISFLLEQSLPAWRRWNAALALGRHGSRAALDPLRLVVSEAAQTEQQKQLRSYAQSSFELLQRRLKLDGQSP